ncbi:hypothetical protein BDV93DRAFT_610239 [Ceratobasidium sp. AG-I]|nr:hypothetical protein BDV93DRAFT_610239 [Ceratobasidium sp. AG-I]
MSATSLRQRKGRSGLRPISFAGIAQEVDPEKEVEMVLGSRVFSDSSLSPFLDEHMVKYRELRDQHRQTSYLSPSASGHMSTYAGMLTADEAKDVDKSNDEERGERPPAWLDLFYDLAWAATFSNLTQNNQISGGQESMSYAVFFSMVWWMWVSQVSYDIRFYSNDWFHRCMIFLQLCTFGALAAFTNHFDVTAYVGRDDKDPNQAKLDALQGVSESQQDANLEASSRIPELSFVGIALLIAISRALLCVQYVRVWLYAHDKRDPAVLVKPLAMFLSTCLWFGSFAVLSSTNYSSETVHISKFIMWGVAAAIEVAGHAFVPPPSHLRSRGSMTARLATLVTIILGEGLNAITGTLKFAVASLGFNKRSGGLVLATALVVYLTFYLYFEGARPRISKNRRALWIFLHLPYMLCVILLLEGLKNLLIYSILYNSLGFVIDKFNMNFEKAASTSDSEFIDILNESMTPFLAKIGLSWEAEWKPVYDALTETGGEEKFFIDLYRLMMNITVKVFDSFDPENITPSGRIAVLKYLRNDSLPLGDSDPKVNGIPNFMAVVNALAEPQIKGARWISGLAGGTLIFLACINVTQSWPKGQFYSFCLQAPDKLRFIRADRYSWGSVLSRLINGCILLGLLLMNINSGDHQHILYGDTTVRGWLYSNWALPTLALSLVVQTIIDHVLLVFSVRSADRANEPACQPSTLDPLRAGENGAYNLPMATSDLTATPASENLTSSATMLLGHNGNNNSPTLGSGKTPPPPPQASTPPHPQS